MPTRPGHSHTPHAGVHVLDHLRVVYRRRWTVALAILVVFVWGAFGTLRKTSIYEATAQILIEKEARRASSLSTVLDQTDSYYDEDFYQTQYRILQSRALAWRAVQALGMDQQASVPAPPQPEADGPIEQAKAWIFTLAGTPPVIEPPPPDETTMQSNLTGMFLGGLTVAPIRNTHLVELRYRSPDPVFAAEAANALAEEYIGQGLETRANTSQETVEYLRGQLDEQRKRVEASERALQDYKEQNDAIGVDDQQNIVVQRLQGLNAQVMQARAERIDKEALFSTIAAIERNQGTLDAFPAIANNEFVQKLKVEVAQLRQHKTQLSARYREGAPQLAQINQQIADVERKLQTEIGNVVEATRNDLRAAQAREQSLSSELERQKNEAMRLNRKGVEYAALEDEATSNRRLYETLLQRSNEIGVSSEFRGSNIRIIDEAEVPRYPVLPNTRRDLMMALLMGCALAVVLAFGFEYMDSRIRTPEEIKAHLGIPYLGLVPAVSSKDMEGETPLLTAEVPPGFSESMRAIRTSVVFSSADEGARSIVITSTGPGEGKTVVSSNLAISLAQAGQRTILIDADMRRPRVHEVFSMAQEPGLSNVLVGTSTVDSILTTTPTANLFVLGAGHLPPNPAELLGSKKYRDLIESLRQRFDWVIVDAPPVMAVTDAAVVANGATGVVFVVGSEMTSRRNAAAAIDRLHAAKARFIGGILNRADVHKHSYYYSTYYRKDYTQAYARR